MLLACTAFALAGCLPPEPPTLDELVADNTAARGGAQAIEAVSVFDADLHIVEPTFEVDGRYVATRDGRMRIDILANGARVFTEALGRERGWSWNPEAGVTETSEKGRAALRHGIEYPLKLFGLHEMAKRGHRLALAGREKIGDVDYHVVMLTLDDGFATRYYVNPQSWLIERERQHRAMHVDVDPTPAWIETEYSDWRVVDGVLFPHRQVEREVESGKILSTMTARAIRVNGAPPPEHFEAP